MSRLPRSLLALFVACSLLAGAGLAPAPASGQTQPTAYVSVSGATVTPASPAPGDTVTVTATLRNLAGSEAAFTIDYVQIRDGGRVKDYVGDLGTLSPGASIDVPMATTFDDAGVKRLRVVAFGEDENGHGITVKYPVVVEVREREPRVDLDVVAPVANADTDVNVTVANGLDDPIHNVEVTVGGVPVEQDRRVRATVAAGTDRNFAFTALAETAGERTVNATVRYTTGSGVRRTARVREQVDFEALRTETVLDVTRLRGGSALAVGLTNLGNAPLENVTVRGRASGATASTATLSAVEPGATGRARLNLTDLTEPTNVSVVASYDVGERHERRERTVRVTPNPGVIELTGLDVERDAGRLHVTGSASNVGLTPVDSVVVHVESTAEVDPAYPAKEYFVGSVPESDFVTFDVYARATPNATSVPLRVTYLVDGRARERRFEVTLDDRVTEPTRESDGGLPVVPLVLAAVVVIGVAAAIYVGWRNSRGGD